MIVYNDNLQPYTSKIKIIIPGITFLFTFKILLTLFLSFYMPQCTLEVSFNRRIILPYLKIEHKSIFRAEPSFVGLLQLNDRTNGENSLSDSILPPTAGSIFFEYSFHHDVL